METDDWQIGKPLHERMLNMLNQQLMCDVIFRVGSEQRTVKAHRCMLASASPVFYSMFEGPLAEQGEICIPDIEEDVFKEIVRYIYTDKVEINEGSVKGLLYGAEKYMLTAVKKECSTFLTSLIDTDHACVVLQTANDFNIENLKFEAVQFIFGHGKACIESDMFLLLSSECLKIIIESNNLKCREELIFKRVLLWGENKCREQELAVTDENVRAAIGDLIYLIRFPLMERKFFTNEVSTRHILSPNEIINVFQSYDGRKVEAFSSKLRLENPVRFYRCDLNEGKTSWTQDGSVDSIEFSADFNGLLLGIIVFGSKEYKGNHDVSVKIIQFFTVLTSTTTTVMSKEGQEMYDVMFIEPIKINKNVRYTIQLTMTGPRTFTGQNYATTITKDDLTVKFAFGISSLNGTNETSGQIPGVIMGRQLE